MSIMNPMDNSQINNQQGGSINVLMLPLILSVVLLLGAIGFGAWAYTSRQDYKNNTDQKIAEAVDVAVKNTQAEDAAKFAEEEKNPLKSYSGPSQFGSVRIEYPKTWSAYTVNRTEGSIPIEWYLNPNVVPNVNDNSNAFALRVQVSSETYDESVSGYESAVRNGEVTIKPYKLPKVPGVVGTQVDGEIESGIQGRMVILPLRNMSLRIWTESSKYVDDLNKIILPRATFSP